VTFGTNDNSYHAVPVLFTGNVMASNVTAGFESWGQKKHPNANSIASYNGQDQFFFVISFPTQPYLVNPIANGKGGTSKCISVSSSYTETLDIEGGRITGCAVGIVDGGAGQYVKTTDTFFQNVLDIDDLSPAIRGMHTNERHKPMPGHPPQYILFSRLTDVWPGPPAPLPGPTAARIYNYQRGGRFHVLKNWQGSGKDYRLLSRAQLSTSAATPASFGLHQFDAPEAGLTVGQNWAKYGQAWGGEAVDLAKTVALEGILAPGLVLEGATIPFGPPRAVLTYPNNFAETVISVDRGNAPYIELDGLVTGDPAAASQDFLFSVDGGPTTTMQASPEWEGDQRRYASRSGLTVGQHTVKTWRTTTTGAKIAASELTFTYTVGLRNGSRDRRR
jgi:hypothetical protein